LLSNVSEQRTEFEFGKFAGVEKNEQNKAKQSKDAAIRRTGCDGSELQNESFLSNGSLHYTSAQAAKYVDVIY